MSKKKAIKSSSCFLLIVTAVLLAVPATPSAAILPQIGLEINGTGMVNENSSAAYEANITFRQFRKVVTSFVEWGVDSPYAAIDSEGRLTTYEVDNDETITITASLVRGRFSRTASLTTTIMNRANETSHAGRFASYEGSKTCNHCHLSSAYEVHDSVHYQWKGLTPDVVDMEEGGKLGSINDFCTYPDISLLFEIKNADGNDVITGCLKCHVGIGKMPDPNPTTNQLENIDCLVCHSESYKRKPVKEGEGQFRFIADTDKISVPLEEAITDIEKPTKVACLACHANAGGGNGLKQGDMELAHADPLRELDVHMASQDKGGAGLDCLDCHIAHGHKFAGRGDLRPTESDVALSCVSCHPDKPHSERDIDKHTDWVDCATCHIPTFARGVPTDVLRDFTESELEPNKRIWEPVITKEANVIPKYLFSNGAIYFYKFGEPIDSGETHLLSAPVGDINDANAKIRPFKFHAAIMPYELDQSRLLPVSAPVLWGTGDVDAAIRQAADDIGWPLNSGYDFVPTERYMSLHHEVAPKDQALSCGDCHGAADRIDFDALGFTPKTERNGRPLCVSCHGDESDEWPASQFFMRMHRKHVDDERIDCGQCHNF